MPCHAKPLLTTITLILKINHLLQNFISLDFILYQNGTYYFDQFLYFWSQWWKIVSMRHLSLNFCNIKTLSRFVTRVTGLAVQFCLVDCLLYSFLNVLVIAQSHPDVLLAIFMASKHQVRTGQSTNNAQIPRTRHFRRTLAKQLSMHRTFAMQLRVMMYPRNEVHFQRKY